MFIIDLLLHKSQKEKKKRTAFNLQVNKSTREDKVVSSSSSNLCINGISKLMRKQYFL